MIHFVLSKSLNVRRTTFPHKDIHKETWHSADGRTAIDQECNTTSEHNLLKINFKVKLRVKPGNKYNGGKTNCEYFFKIQNGNKTML